jgi:formylglycine-generating enzyme required for sulfatase activity/lysophospholipase L1-like esterase
LFSSFLLTATILTVALLAFVPVPFGQAGSPGGDTVPKELSLDLGKGVSMKLVHIPAGKFKMGNHDTPAETIKKVGGVEEHVSDEYPAHEVTISKPFYMGIYELTQAQWKAVMGTEPWMKKGIYRPKIQQRPPGFDDYPVVWVSSYDAIEFCRKLSKKTGMSVSLPTEAQWEYACRAGTTTAFSFGDELSKLNDHGWYGGRVRDPNGADGYAHRVGQRKPNAWGLYDMHGNVWEFCSDWYDKDFYSRAPSVDPENTTKSDHRSLRSGSYFSAPTLSRSAQRNSWTSPETARYNYGMRVVVAADTAVPAGSRLNAEAGEIAVKDGEAIAFLGDSITAAGRDPGGYCQFVLAALKDQGINTTAVFAGIGGHKSDQMLARLEKDVLNHQPNWMTLSCGVNDVWHGKNGVELEPYTKNITEIVDRAQAAGVKVLLLTSTMIKEDQANGLNQKLVAYNDFIRQLAKDKGCLLADVNADMQLALKTPPPNRPDGKKLTSDGVHMNPYGNIMMGRGVAKALGATDVQLDESEKAWRSVSSHRVRLGDIKLSIDEIEALSSAAKAEGTDLGGLLRKGAEARKDELLK